MEYNTTYRRKDNGWQIIVSYKDSDGKWRQKSKQGFESKKVAKTYEEEILKVIKGSLKQESFGIPSDFTFKKLFNEFYEHQTLYKEHNTLKGYITTFNNFNYLHNKKVEDLKKNDIQKCIDGLIKSGLKYDTIKNYLKRLRLVLQYYSENYNDTFTLNLSKMDILKDKDNKAKKALTNSEIKNILKCMEGNKYYMVVYLASNTGMRCGEILGLTWDDINFKDMVINVNRQWKYLKSGKYGFGDLKTKNSNRLIPISPTTVKKLKQWQTTVPTDLSNRVCPYNKCNIDMHVNTLLRELAGVSIHELRHSYATLLIANGLDFKTVASLLGHTVEQTMRTYSHVTSDMFKTASDKIREIF